MAASQLRRWTATARHGRPRPADKGLHPGITRTATSIRPAEVEGPALGSGGLAQGTTGKPIPSQEFHQGWLCSLPCSLLCCAVLLGALDCREWVQVVGAAAAQVQRCCAGQGWGELGSNGDCARREQTRRDARGHREWCFPKVLACRHELLFSDLAPESALPTGQDRTDYVRLDFTTSTE